MNELSDFLAWIYRTNLATLPLIIGEVHRIRAERVRTLEMGTNMKAGERRDTQNPGQQGSSAARSDALTENS
jgi:hypothetical protein